MGRHKGPIDDPELIVSMEEFMMIKVGVLHITLNEFNEMPMKKVLHFIGFAKGHMEMETQKSKQKSKAEQFNAFRRT